MPQLSDRKSANASSGARTLRQISNPALPVRPTAQGESHFPTLSKAARSYSTEITKPTNAVKAPILCRQRGPLHNRERLDGTGTGWLLSTGLRGTNSTAAREKHLQPCAAMPRRELDQTAPSRAPKPDWLGNPGHSGSAWHLILWARQLFPRLTSL